MMTDAVGRYILANKEVGVDQLFPFLRGSSEFNLWANKMRNQRNIEDDDLTLVEINF